MFNLISALSRKQKSYVFLAIDLGLIPLALLFTLTVQPLPDPALHTLAAMLPVLPYVMLVMAASSVWLGLPMVQLNAYERHAVALTGVVAVMTAVVLAVLTHLFGPDLPSGTHVVFATSYMLFMMATRAFLHQIVLMIYRRASPRCRVLIYGAGTTGTQLAQALKSHDGIDPVAFVDDNGSLQGMTLVGLQVFAPLPHPGAGANPSDQSGASGDALAEPTETGSGHSTPAGYGARGAGAALLCPAHWRGGSGR